MKIHFPIHLNVSLWEKFMNTVDRDEFINTLNYDNAIDLLLLCEHMEHEEDKTKVARRLAEMFDDLRKKVP